MLRELQDLLHLDCMTVTGETLRQRVARGAAVRGPRRNPAADAIRFRRMGGLVALFGSLALRAERS